MNRAAHQQHRAWSAPGCYRTNVWTFPGANTWGRGREAALAAHPTVKPVELVAEAIRDCSKRGSIVLDPFAGSGTTLLAAERTRRVADALELDPHYVDVAVQRFQELHRRAGSAHRNGGWLQGSSEAAPGCLRASSEPAGSLPATVAGMSGKSKVGYKNPPLHTRFAKGRSGNPRGRPRGVKEPKSRPSRRAARDSDRARRVA